MGGLWWLGKDGWVVDVIVWRKIGGWCSCVTGVGWWGGCVVGGVVGGIGGVIVWLVRLVG